MDETSFTSKVSGSVRFDPDGMYPYFQPNTLPFDIDFDRGIRRRSLDAIIALSNLNGMISGMEPEEKGVLLSALTLKESVHSSSIEGTRSTISDMLLSEKEELDGTLGRDVKEVNNYREALLCGTREMEDGGRITVGLIHKLHRMLLEGTRGSNKSPGEFKTEQNAIGMPGDTLETAKMVPAPPESVEYLIDNLLEYMDSDEDPLIKIALIHYQFEAIHPYRDGNGRIGRLLVMLLLEKEGILTFPAIYPSEYFDRHRDEYIDSLFGVSSEDRFEEWVGFFIGAMRVQTEYSLRMIRSLGAYRKQLESDCASMKEMQLIGMLFVNPYLRIKDVASKCSVSLPTASKMVSKLVASGVLRETTDRRRNRLFVADGVLEILTMR